jgi:hypothetical protein
VVPYALRSPDLSFLAQANRLGWLRDYAFNFYQVNLAGLVGLAGLVLLLRAWRGPRGPISPALPPGEKLFWLLGIVVAIPLGIGVNGAMDNIGLAHICLQPLALLGLACGAARLGREQAAGGSRRLTTIFLVAALADLVLGIGLQLGGEAFLLQRAQYPTDQAYVSSLTFAAQANYAGKLRLNQPFLHDVLALSPLSVAIVLAGLLVVVAALALRPRSVGSARA